MGGTSTQDSSSSSAPPGPWPRPGRRPGSWPECPREGHRSDDWLGRVGILVSEPMNDRRPGPMRREGMGGVREGGKPKTDNLRRHGQHRLWMNGGNGGTGTR